MFSSNLDNTFGFDDEHPGARLLADHALQKEVCRSHLTLVDALPGALESTTASRVIQISRASWDAHVRFYEDVIAGVLPRRDDVQWNMCLNQLKGQHAEISVANDELLDTAEDVKSGTKPMYALSYLLRNIAQRREEHVMIEKLLVLTALPLVLSPVERTAYREWTTRNPWPLAGIENLL